MRGSFLVYFISSLIVGILIGRLPQVPVWVAVFPVVAALTIYLYSVIAGRKNPLILTSNSNLAVGILIFMGLGVFTSALRRPHPVNFEAGKYAFSGIVEDYTPKGNGDLAVVELNSLAKIEDDGARAPIDVLNLKLLVTVQGEQRLDYGDRIDATGYFYPVDFPGNYIDTDYQKFLKGKAIFLKGFADAADCSIAPGSDFLPSREFKHWRDELEIAIEKTPLQRATKDFIISVLLGDKSYVRSEDRILFADAGVSHIFAVSGFHVSMISVFLLAVLSLFFIRSSRKWQYLVCVPLVWFYILLVGASPATCRAGIMLTITFVALFMQRKRFPLLILGWTVLLILSFSPNSLFDIGFQLSVICVGAIVMIARPLNFMRHREHPRLYKLVSLILVTLVATFSVWLVCGFYFHKFSLIFLPLNLMAVPLLPLFVILFLIYFVFHAVGFESVILGDFLDAAYDTFHKTADLLTSNTYIVEDFYPNLWAVWLWIAGLGALAYCFHRRDIVSGKKGHRKLYAVPLILFLSSCICLFMLEPGAELNGFIIQKDSNAVAVTQYSGHSEETYTLPEASASIVEINDKKVLSLHTNLLKEEVLKRIPEADIIMLCGGCRSLPSEIIELKKDNTLVTVHPTVHWRYERNILSEADERGLAVHSIRYDGPLHVFD